MEKGDDVTRDFLHGVKDNRELRLLPFYSKKQQKAQIVRLTGELHLSKTKNFEEKEKEVALKKVVEGEPVRTVRPIIRAEKEGGGGSGGGDVDEGVVFRVYTPLRLLREYLQRKEFKMVDDPQDADILWLYDHFHNWKELKPPSAEKAIYVNQYPDERLHMSY